MEGDTPTSTEESLLPLEPIASHQIYLSNSSFVKPNSLFTRWYADASALPFCVAIDESAFSIAKKYMEHMGNKEETLSIKTNKRAVYI